MSCVYLSSQLIRTFLNGCTSTVLQDPSDLWNTDNEQAIALFDKMVKQMEDNCLSENKISAVCCQEAKRDPANAPKPRPAPAVAAAAAQPVKPRAGNGAAEKIDAIMKGAESLTSLHALV